MLPTFTGEFGGTLAAASIAGVSLGWSLCKKILVDPLSARLATAEAKQDAINERIADHFWNDFPRRLDSMSTRE